MNNSLKGISMLNKDAIIKEAQAFAELHKGKVILVYGAAEVIHGAKELTNNLDLYLVTREPFDFTGWEELAGSVSPKIYKQGIFDLALLPEVYLVDPKLVQLTTSVYVYDLPTIIALREELSLRLNREKDHAALKALKAL